MVEVEADLSQGYILHVGEINGIKIEKAYLLRMIAGG